MNMFVYKPPPLFQLLYRKQIAVKKFGFATKFIFIIVIIVIITIITIVIITIIVIELG